MIGAARFLILFALLLGAAATSAPRPRARDLQILIGQFPTGKRNTIADVTGVKVGHVTLHSGEGKLKVGVGPVRTGVTVIVPPGDVWNKKLFAGADVHNGNGEATGLMWLKESGVLETPIALTNTLSVADAQKGLVEWMLEKHPNIGINDDTLTPVVLECDDSSLNDIRGFHVKPAHVKEAIAAASEKVTEGSVGAGTGTIGFDFKAGIGTASRVVKTAAGSYTIGVILNNNLGGTRDLFRVLGAEAGKKLKAPLPKSADGSVVVVVATDAPLDGRQLSRLAKRALAGIARLGPMGYHGSGDVAVAFSTANRIPHYPKSPLLKISLLSDFAMNDLFEAVADATEEATLNSVLASPGMTGRDGFSVPALPTEQLVRLLGR